MASTTEIEKRKLELAQRLEKSRNAVLGAKLLLGEQITKKKTSLFEALNIPKKIKRSFSENPLKAFGIVTASGLGASILLKRKPRRQKASKTIKQSMFTKLALSAIRPIIQKAITQYAQQWFAQRTQKKVDQNQLR